MDDKITSERFVQIMNGSRGMRLRELMSEAQPYLGMIEDVNDKKRTEANGQFFFLAYDLMPFIFRYIDSLQSEKE